MAKLSTMKFKGKSGAEYSFDVYPLDTNWKDNISGVYFVTRRHQKADSRFYHDKIYVGQSTDIKERHVNHHRESCFSKKDANCLCILIENSETRRLAIEKDLIDGNDLPCNKQ